ncbi:hypothetical protein [Streptomyces sp. NPDC050738]|uniref:hypothetical protein n=1 Tax=Streptomyces sp. NPDC050738 TaxID=3154744 RepID=UPI003414CE21
MSQTALPRRGRLLRIAAAVAVALAVAGYLVAQYETGGGGPPRCTAASADGDSYRMSPEQAVNAATISAVGTTRGMPERAVTIALATALQESGLRNLDHGDRDSLGLFQQRPSQGWGTAKQITDPVYAAGKFYDHLAKVPGYSRLPLTVAAQRVQRSGFPQAYAKHEPDAALLSAALTGRTPAAFTCSAAKGATKGDAARVRTELARDFGPGVLPTARGAVSGPVLDLPVASTAAAGATGGPQRTQRGWELAHWAVAHSSELQIEQVSYAGREWTAGDADNTWHKTDEKTAGVRLTLSK